MTCQLTNACLQNKCDHKESQWKDFEPVLHVQISTATRGKFMVVPKGLKTLAPSRAIGLRL